MSLVRQSLGKDYDSRFGSHAAKASSPRLAQRFQLACKRLGFNRRDQNYGLDCAFLRRPGSS